MSRTARERTLDPDSLCAIGGIRGQTLSSSSSFVSFGPREKNSEGTLAPDSLSLASLPAGLTHAAQQYRSLVHSVVLPDLTVSVATCTLVGDAPVPATTRSSSPNSNGGHRLNPRGPRRSNHQQNESGHHADRSDLKRYVGPPFSLSRRRPSARSRQADTYPHLCPYSSPYQ